MKNTAITFLLLFFSMTIYGQVNSVQIIGEWKYDNTTNLLDSVVDSPVKVFNLSILKDGKFKIHDGKINVNGNWSLNDSTLNLTGIKEGTAESKSYNLKIVKSSTEQLSFEMKGELGTTLINLKKESK